MGLRRRLAMACADGGRLEGVGSRDEGAEGGVVRGERVEEAESGEDWAEGGEGAGGVGWGEGGEGAGGEGWDDVRRGVEVAAEKQREQERAQWRSMVQELGGIPEWIKKSKVCALESGMGVM